MDLGDIIEIVERTDEHGRAVLEIRELMSDHRPRIPNDRILGIGARARRYGYEAIGNFETGDITFHRIA